MISLPISAQDLDKPIEIFHNRAIASGCSVPSVTDITVYEDSVRRKLKAIKPNKSAGPDDIAPKLLKLAEPAIVSPLTGLFSFCAHLGETFTDWKKARLISVYKKDDEADTNNYRPISLLSVPSKIMESCVSESVVRHVFHNNLVTDKQWAYREGHSTELLLVHLSEIWRTAIDDNNNNNNLIFILRKIHVNMIKCALHESKLSTLISYPK